MKLSSALSSIILIAIIFHCKEVECRVFNLGIKEGIKKIFVPLKKDQPTTSTVSSFISTTFASTDLDSSGSKMSSHSSMRLFGDVLVKPCLSMEGAEKYTEDEMLTWNADYDQRAFSNDRSQFSNLIF
ncbi:hypothetical protein C0J52_03255 [Blattella germanica]|nr:hypothetical protein C0J52_03255 [Blattella germanica]